MVEALLYGVSLMLVLPEGKCDPRSPSLGAVIRPSQLKRIAVQAGFWTLRLVAKDDESGMSHYLLL
jgi:hypothetical protein